MNQDEQILNDLDEVLAHPDLATRLQEGERLRAVERMQGFEAISHEWINAALKENKDADPPSLPAIYRLGSLGQSLIFQAFTEGVKQGIKMGKQ